MSILLLRELLVKITVLLAVEGDAAKTVFAAVTAIAERTINAGLTLDEVAGPIAAGAVNAFDTVLAADTECHVA